MWVVVQVWGCSHGCSCALSKFNSGNWGWMDEFQHRRQMLFDPVRRRGWKVRRRRLFLREKKRSDNFYGPRQRHQAWCRLPTIWFSLVSIDVGQSCISQLIGKIDLMGKGGKKWNVSKPEVNGMLWCSAAHINNNGILFYSYDIVMDFND